MNKPMIALFVAFAHLTLATPSITNVTAQQRYPWNGKVDISYMVSGVASAPDAWPKVTATDGESGQTYTASSLSGDTALTDGTHSLVWDMAAQGLALVSTNVVFSVSCETPPLYCVINLSSGANASAYPVAYFDEPPTGGFNTDEYKTTKLVLRLIAPGTFMMCGQYQTTLTKPYYMGLFEVTQKQYSLVMGSNPSIFSGDKRPVEKVSYNMIRGSESGAGWPSSSAVDSSSFMGKLRSRTGLGFDLPTEAQWEYACRAGTTTTYSYGDNSDRNYMWYNENSYSSMQTHDVGTKLPNAWGFYDMHGHVWEWCRDWYGDLSSPLTDPKGSSSGANRVIRGGSWNWDASECTSSDRYQWDPSDENNGIGGFRLTRVLE